MALTIEQQRNQSQWTSNFNDVVTDVFEIVAGVLPEDNE